MKNILKHHARLRRQFRRDKRGVSAIEFGFIFPMMVIMYLGAVDISQVLTADRKVTALSSTVADLIAQAEELNGDDMTDIYNASVEILSPLPATDLSIVVTAVEIDSDDNLAVDWSDAYNGTARSSVSGLTIPDGMIDPGGSVVVAEVEYLYDSILSKFVGQDFELSDRFFLRPRRTSKIQFTP